MFESVEALAARLASSPPPGPDRTDPLWVFADPVLDPDGSLVDQLVLLERVKSAAEARSMMIMAELCVRAEGWVQPAPGPRTRDDLDSRDLAAAEVAPALRLAPVTAGIRIDRATRIVSRLPGTLRAFAAGLIDTGRVRAIDDATEFLTDENAAKVETIVLPGAPDQTAGELRAALRTAVIAIDPTAAETRRKEAVKGRSIRRYGRPDGMSAIEAVVSAIDTGDIYDLIDDIARASKTDGDTRSMDARRADAFVFLLLGRDPHLGPDEPPEDNQPPDDPDRGDAPEPPPPDDRPAPTDHDAPADPYDDGRAGADADAPADPYDDARAAAADPDEPGPAGDGDEHDPPGPDDQPDVSGAPRAEHDPAGGEHAPAGPDDEPDCEHDPAGDDQGAAGPGEEPDSVQEPTQGGHGPAATSRGPDGHGRADRDTADRPNDPSPAGDAEPAVTAPAREHDEVPWPEEPPDLDDRFPPEGPPVREPGRRVSELVALCMAALCARRVPALPWVTFSTIDGPDGPVTVAHLQGEGPITAEWGQHLLATGAARPPPSIAAAAATLTPQQMLTHDPPPALAAAIRARDGTCRHPGCRRAAHRCDADHTIRFPDGPTIPENLSALCRRHHRVKHEGGWTLRQTDDATLIWTTVLGRVYATHPRGPDDNERGTVNVDVNTWEPRHARAA